MYATKAIEHINNGGNAASADELMGIAKQYPYFAVPQVLLLLQQKNSFSSTSHLQKLQVFSPNNTWLQFILNETVIEEPILKSIDDIQFEKNKLVEPITNYNGFEDTQEPTIEQSTVAIEEPAFISVATQPTKTEEQNSIASTPKEEIPVFEPVNFGEFTTAETIISATTNGVDTELTNAAPQMATVPGSIIEVPSLETVRQLLQGKTPSTNTVEQANTDTILAPAISILEEPIAAKTQIPSYQFNGFSNGTPYANGNAVQLSEDAYNSDVATAEAEAEEELENQNEPLENSKLSSVLNKQLDSFNKPIEADAKLDFETETYYTVDYFASQGIKIDLTKEKQDKLTIQLRRFTDWLKQMKNSNPNPTDLGTDPELEKAIQNIAKTSLEAREIVTETMADVFIKQGKVDKAIQLYIKLSFLDPHKSTYFAKKIEQLKGF